MARGLSAHIIAQRACCLLDRLLVFVLVATQLEPHYKSRSRSRDTSSLYQQPRHNVSETSPYPREDRRAAIIPAPVAGQYLGQPLGD